MTEHRFTKGVMDYGCGALQLVRSRAREHRAKTGAYPRQLVLHAPTARRLFTEYAAEQGEALPPERVLRGTVAGIFEGIPFCICQCGDDFGEDQLVDQLGNVEPL